MNMHVTLNIQNHSKNVAVWLWIFNITYFNKILVVIVRNCVVATFRDKDWCGNSQCMSNNKRARERECESAKINKLIVGDFLYACMRTIVSLPHTISQVDWRWHVSSEKRVVCGIINSIWCGETKWTIIIKFHQISAVWTERNVFNGNWIWIVCLSH